VGDGENYIIRSFVISFSPNTIGVIKPRTVGWAGHVAHVDERCIQHFDRRTL